MIVMIDGIARYDRIVKKIFINRKKMKALSITMLALRKKYVEVCSNN